MAGDSLLYTGAAASPAEEPSMRAGAPLCTVDPDEGSLTGGHVRLASKNKTFESLYDVPAHQ